MKINWHNVKTIALWLIIAAIGAVTALQGSGTIGDVTILISILGFIEHLIQGNSTTKVPLQ